jgi:hypothetical protein
MRNFVLITVLFLASCTVFDDVDPEVDASVPVVDASTVPDPEVQCAALVAVFCDAAYDCGWQSDLPPCEEFYGHRCAANKTVYPENMMVVFKRRLRSYECVPNEIWIEFFFRTATEPLDTMLSWSQP